MKYILITGCSDNSIGCALTKEFSTHSDVHIFSSSRKLTSMSSLSTIPNVTLLELDVTSPPSISAAVQTIITKTSGKLDYLVNYAGFGYTMPFLDTDIEGVSKKMFDVNVWGPMRVTQAFMPLVLEAKGMVVMAGSSAELLAVPFQGAYCASKAALWILSESLRVEVKPLGVRVLHVTTGNIRSNWFSNVPAFELPKDSYYQPVARQIETRAIGKHDIPWMEADVYAKRVVSDILANKEGRVYRGVMSSLAKFAVDWLPQWVLDREKIKGTGLDGYWGKK